MTSVAMVTTSTPTTAFEALAAVGASINVASRSSVKGHVLRWITAIRRSAPPLTHLVQKAHGPDGVCMVTSLRRKRFAIGNPYGTNHASKIALPSVKLPARRGTV